MRTRIPRSHPRYHSLVTRERMRDALRRGLIHETGLIAHGRGEAFDYLLGEATPAPARKAIRAAASALLAAKRPVVCGNGNAIALAAPGLVAVAKAARARLEVNLFHRDERRVRRLVRELEVVGARDVLGPDPDARIPGLESDRAKSHSEGTFGADVVVVPLEDGDRCLALKRMGKFVIAIDLNPLSRTARAADITVVDEVQRALLLLARELRAQKRRARSPRRPAFDNGANLAASLAVMRRNLARRPAP